MADNNMVIAISAFSGLAGSVLTQVISGTIAYFSDKRKQRSDVKMVYRNKKLEIGENFYYVTSEKVSLIRIHIQYWRKREFVRSAASLAFLNEEMKKLAKHLDRLNADSWKYNLINLYYSVSLTNHTLLESNASSQGYYLKFLDTIDEFKKAGEQEDKEELKARYALILFDMCRHYEDLCLRMEQDMTIVRDTLLSEFGMVVK